MGEKKQAKPPKFEGCFMCVDCKREMAGEWPWHTGRGLVCDGCFLAQALVKAADTDGR